MLNLSLNFLALVHWSVFTSLAPTLFYFSVWQLGIAGHELSLLSLLSPILLRNRVILDVASSKAGRTILHIFTLSGQLAYFSKSPLIRLFIVAFANFALSIGVAVDWSQPLAGVGYQATGVFIATSVDIDRAKLIILCLVTSLGFLLSSLLKHANHTNLPCKLG